MKGEQGPPGKSNATVIPGPKGDKGDRGAPGEPGRNGNSHTPVPVLKPIKANPRLKVN